jgi:hypothetical protein
MPPENIVAITAALCSLATSLLTGVFVYKNSSFGDNQLSKVGADTKFYYPNGKLMCETGVNVDLSNIEEFETKSTKFTNDKGEVKKVTTTKKLIPKGPSLMNLDDPKVVLKKLNSKLELLSKDDESKDEEKAMHGNEFFNADQTSELNPVLHNNNLGDKEISETRQLIFYKACGAYEIVCKQIVKLMKSFPYDEANSTVALDEVYVSGNDSSTESYEDL